MAPRPAVSIPVFGLVTGALLASLPARVHSAWEVAAAAWLIACAVPLAWIDVKTRRLPDFLTVAAYTGVMAVLSSQAAVTGHWSAWVRALAGGAALAGFYLAFLVARPSSVGAGDVKAAASAGALMAWASWATLVGGTFAAFLAAALYGGWLLMARRITSARALIPFGPCLFAGCVMAIFFMPGG